MSLATAIRNSFVFRAAVTVRRWGRHSVTASLLEDRRVLFGILGTVLLVSAVSVLASRMDAAMKFLSFLVVAALTVTLTWSLTNPSPE